MVTNLTLGLLFTENQQNIGIQVKSLETMFTEQRENPFPSTQVPCEVNTLALEWRCAGMFINSNIELLSLLLLGISIH